MTTLPDRTGPRALLHRLRARAPQVLWLTLVWNMLWGSFTPLTAVGGVLVGILVTGAVRLPLAPYRLPVRPWALLRLAGYLGYQLVVSSGDVAWQALRYGPKARGAIIAVPLLTSSDRVATVVANAVSLTPGTLTLQVDQRNRTWYVYALGPRDAAALERARRQAWTIQRRVIVALGSPPERAQATGHGG